MGVGLALLEEVERIRLDATLKSVASPVKGTKLVSHDGRMQHDRYACVWY